MRGHSRRFVAAGILTWRFSEAKEHIMKRDSSGRFKGRQGSQPQSSLADRQTPRGQGQQSCAPSSMATGFLSLLGGAALGTLAMYLLDPDQGDQRRAAARQIARRALRTTADAARSAYQHTSH